MSVDSSEIYTSIADLFFHVSFCVAMSLRQELYKDQLYNWYTIRYVYNYMFIPVLRGIPL